MRKLILLVVLALVPAPLWGQGLEVVSFTAQSELTFENLTCMRGGEIGDETFCTYSQGDGQPLNTDSFAIYQLIETDPNGRGDLCWVITWPDQTKGAFTEQAVIDWFAANMVGRSFCIESVEGGVVDTADGMLYIADPTVATAVKGFFLNQKGEQLSFPRT